MTVNGCQQNNFSIIFLLIFPQIKVAKTNKYFFEGKGGLLLQVCLAVILKFTCDALHDLVTSVEFKKRAMWKTHRGLLLLAKLQA